MKQKVLKRYLDEVCDMLDTYGGRDKVSFYVYKNSRNFQKREKDQFRFLFNLNRMEYETAGHCV